MDLTLLDTLRYKLEFGSDFSEIFGYFFDHFGEKEEFFDHSIPTQDDLLVSLIGHIGGHLLKRDKVVLKDLRLMLVPGHNFIHGSCLLEPYIATIIYFDDIQKGILAASRPLVSPKTDFYRFTAEMLNKKATSKVSYFKH